MNPAVAAMTAFHHHPGNFNRPHRRPGQPPAPKLCGYRFDDEVCGLPTDHPAHVWVMPDWMEPYREDFRETGGNSVETLMNDHDANGFNNYVLTALIVACHAQVGLLTRLHRKGYLGGRD